jgi:hypothetical protein
VRQFLEFDELPEFAILEVSPEDQKGQKGPPDVIGNAVRVTQIATGEVAEDALEAGKEYARKGGLIGGPQSARKSVTVDEWKEITRAVSQDGQQRMIVKLTPNDLYRFVEETFRTEDAPVALMPPRSYWAPSQMSGLYESAEDAERAAYMELRWLRISN